MIAPAYSDAFNTFYAAFPRRQKKADAWKAWQQEGLTGADLPILLGALDWQVRQPGWTKEGGAFIPLPATWLRARQFEDEPFHVPMHLGAERTDTVGLANAKALADYMDRVKQSEQDALPLLRLVK